ncbi:MAG: SEC-C metal-binding domain-containing protein [Armatimonadota bacterium]
MRRTRYVGPAAGAAGAGDGGKKAATKVKVGRNDPCPCGSGKKYKKCCLNKQ